LITFNQIGETDLMIPSLIFGTSSLGNLYRAMSYSAKKRIIEQILLNMKKPVVLDTAGKYGAGLALEMLGKILPELKVSEDEIIVSNKLGWQRVPLTAPEPTFEKGAWKKLKFDAIQHIGYHGILKCWKQGNDLLEGKYKPQMVSVHDPDEYFFAAKGEKTREKRLADIIDAYQALIELKRKGETRAVGVGAKNWKIIPEIMEKVNLDWVMLANSLTLYQHPPDLLELVNELNRKKISIINSAVFQGGFLTGSNYFDYKKLDTKLDRNRPIYHWREQFFFTCQQFDVEPSAACVQFAMSPPGVISIAMNTSRPERIKQNIALLSAQIPPDFWSALKKNGLLSYEYPYLP
jgi:D-threo-aldose 1-dehydrogenase